MWIKVLYERAIARDGYILKISHLKVILDSLRRLFLSEMFKTLLLSSCKRGRYLGT